MIPTENTTVPLFFAFLLTTSIAYAVGRLHERRQSPQEHEHAFREGYTAAIGSTFSLATRVATWSLSRSKPKQPVTEIDFRQPRHSAEARGGNTIRIISQQDRAA